MAALDLADQPLPEDERLGVGVVDAEDADPLADPVIEDALELLPELAPRLALEVEGIDVLVLLGRVLGVLDGAVGTLAEPFGMLVHVGMVGRALEGDVHGDLEAVVARLGEQLAEVGGGPQLGQDRLVSPRRAADRPGAADVAGLGHRAVVLALAVGEADGVDGRQVEDVEAHLGDVRQACDDVAEGAVAAGLRRARAREHLVPAPEAPPPPVHAPPPLPLGARPGARPARPRASALRPAVRARSAAWWISAAPASRSRATSWPASTRLRRSRRQVLKGCTHAVTV